MGLHLGSLCFQIGLNVCLKTSWVFLYSIRVRQVKLLNSMKWNLSLQLLNQQFCPLLTSSLINLYNVRFYLITRGSSIVEI